MQNFDDRWRRYLQDLGYLVNLYSSIFFHQGLHLHYILRQSRYARSSWAMVVYDMDPTPQKLSIPLCDGGIGRGTILVHIDKPGMDFQRPTTLQCKKFYNGTILQIVKICRHGGVVSVGTQL